MPHLEVYGGLQNANTYIAVKSGRIRAVLIFRQERHDVTVINESFRIGSEEMARFATYIFRTCRSVRKIRFNAVATDMEGLNYAVQHFSGTSHTIVPLPPTENQYLEKLGKSTRRTIQYRLNRLRRDFPTCCHEVQDREAISEQDLLAVMAFNRMRMAGKHKPVHLDEQAVARIAALAKRCGFLSVVRIDGRVCAGTILHQTGKTVTSHVNAHALNTMIIDSVR